MKAFALAVLLFAALASSKPQGPPEPDQIVELFRHGARGPLYLYDDTWPASEYGMLTPVGLRQQYILGKVLSEKYPDLVGSTYNYSQVYLLSDTTPRCIQSAGAHLYGIYLGTGPALPDNYPPELAVPPFKDVRVDEIADSLPDSQALPYNFVPGIIEVVDQTNGYIFQGDQSTYCPNERKWSSENEKDALAKHAFEIFGETIANVNKHLNESLQIKNASDITKFGDTMLVDLYQNKSMPAGLTDPALITNMTWAFSWFTYHLWGGQQVQKELAAFNLVQAMLEQLASFRQGETYNTAAFFSGHDDNIWAVLGAFGFVNEQCILDNFYSVLANGTLVHPACYYPYFASDLILEFFNETETPYVKFYYNNMILPICNGQYNCSYDDFIVWANNAVGNNTLDSYFELCGANSTYLSKIGVRNVTSQELFFFSKMTSIRTEVLIIAGLSIVCIMLLVKMTLNKKKYEEGVKSARGESVLYDKLINIEA